MKAFLESEKHHPSGGKYIINLHELDGEMAYQRYISFQHIFFQRLFFQRDFLSFLALKFPFQTVSRVERFGHSRASHLALISFILASF